MINSAVVYPAIAIAENHPMLTLTPVAQMMPLIIAGISPDVTDAINADSDFIDPTVIVKGSQQVDAAGICQHDNMITDIQRLSVTGMQRTFNLARSVINPFTVDASQVITDKINAAASTGADLNIVAVFEPPISKLSTFLGLTERFGLTYSGMNPVQFDLFGGRDWDDLNDLEQAGFCSTGVASIDELIPSMLLDLRGSFFNPFELAKSNGNANVSAIKFLLFLHAINNVPDGINMGLAEYTQNATCWLAKSACAFNIDCENLSRFTRTNQIFWRSRLDMASNTINVYAPVYNQWLKDGGSPEIIMGMVRSGKSELDKGKLLANQETYLKALANYYSAKRATAITLLESTRKRAVAEYFINYINTEVAEEDRTTALNRFNAYVGTNPLDVAYDLPTYIRNLICTVFYPNTQACIVLSEIQKVMDSNPEMDIREASEIAAINWVGDFLMSLVTVTKVKG